MSRKTSNGANNYTKNIEKGANKSDKKPLESARNSQINLQIGAGYAMIHI